MEKSMDIRTNRRMQYVKALALVVFGVLVNYTGSKIVSFFGAPIYLDTIGTILIALTGGMLPGIFTGLATNILTGVTGGTSFYFCIINVMIAFIVSVLNDRGILKKLYGKLLCLICIAAVGGGVGAVISHYVYETYRTGAYTPNFLPEGFVSNGLLLEILDCLCGDFIDKLLSLIIVYVILKFVSEDFRKKLMIEGWKQRPMTRGEHKASGRKRIRQWSLKTKTILLLVMTCIMITLIGCGVSFYLYRASLVDKNEVIARSVAELVATTINPDHIETYIREGSSNSEYVGIEKKLENIAVKTKNIQYIYVYKIQEDGCHVVFDVNSIKDEKDKPGDILPFDKSFEENVPALLRGEEIPAVIADDAYGWLLTVYVPVRDGQGNVVSYAAADIAMADVRNDEIAYLVKIISFFMAFTILLISLALWIARYDIVYPINAISISASDFVYDSEKTRKQNVEILEGLRIETGDEIENLYKSILATTKESMSFVEEMEKQNDQISQMQIGLIMILADLVESRDRSTGDHVRKTAEYTKLIMENLLKMGAYTDEITPEFIYDVYHSAPLHDIGKISVSDSILNKPGKLTDEEFELMKLHTTAGRDIIDQAMKNISGSTYLAEARNLAAYHHEKWNGKGYPEGLSGEDIPLSARVMAVADVFDALVSKRVYKEAFSFEKAMSIIKEGAGNHFDPLVVEAFAMDESKIIKIMEKFQYS
ncbi:MAG: HD domain-containing protein [Eubacterium sp.]|nr:HD domain-containing protein [Eubacterium sp.]